jgi:hypothetical protein
MNLNRAALAVVLLAGAGLAGCSTATKVFGGGSAPDEFRTVASAPLVVPPDYSLRPPKPGEPRPQELQPESAARVALLGQREGEARSDGEKLFVAKAGADRADPLVRYVVDDEFGDIAHKDKSFADKVIFWRKDKPDAGAAYAANDPAPAPIDPTAEARQIKQLTGDQQVVIQRDKRSTSFIKLPGL